MDLYGTWSEDPGFGAVWYPRTVDIGWAPYRHGHWVWVRPWGWSWVDEAPWGFAPFHYGRWAFVGSQWWGWVPGPVVTGVRPVYAPALVVFAGGVGGAPGVAWFPLGPGEVYRPSYHASQRYWNRVNISNTRVSNVTVVNVYNNTVRNRADDRQHYSNQRVQGAITAAPRDAFGSGRSIARAGRVISPTQANRCKPPNRLEFPPSSRLARKAGRP